MAEALFRRTEALNDNPHAPKNHPKKLPEAVRQAIREARSELEAEADEPGKLSYISAYAVQTRLRKKKISPLPSITSIERELRAAQMTRPRKSSEATEICYPRLQPTQPLELIQVDIVPHYLPGVPCVSCFNAIDVASHFPTGQPSLTKRSGDAVNFLFHVWREIGIPKYTQVDNESCFSGGFAHPGVLGKVLRVALLVGTQLVFSPVRHPESNGTIERFHQDYSKNVWKKIDLPDFQAVQQHSPAFFEAYRHSEHHSALRGHCPADLHPARLTCPIPEDFRLPTRLPITVGQVHFIRRVSKDGKVRVLNLDWEVLLAQSDQEVWATLEFTLHGAALRIFDDAPDAREGTCLAEYEFPLKEEVQPLPEIFQRTVPLQEASLFRTVLDRAVDSFIRLISTML